MNTTESTPEAFIEDEAESHDTERPGPPEGGSFDSDFEEPMDLDAETTGPIESETPGLIEGESPGLLEGEGLAVIDGESPGLIEQARALSDDHLGGLLESLVFASDKPIGSRELARLASAPLGQVKRLMGQLKESSRSRGIVLDEVAGGWLFRTNVLYAPFVRELTSGRPVRLSRAQIETLAIVAYRQPVTRPEIDDIRGVDSGATLRVLLERELLRILGKKEEVGRPLLYGTTAYFLEFFGLKSIKDLPPLREFTELSEESRRLADAELEAAEEPRA